MKYLCDPHILPTNTCPPDLSELARRTERFAEFAAEVQLDVADGSFAPTVSWPYENGQREELSVLVQQGEKLPLADRVGYEAHLMVDDPAELGSLLARAGCIRLLYHVETTDSKRALQMLADWRSAGAKEVGAALLIDTPLEAVDEIVESCNVVQLMSIAKIGAQGQPFDERAISRVEELHAKYPDLMVAVDGGISESNIDLLVRAGANRLCIGSAISSAPNPEVAYATLHERAMRGCAPLSAAAAV